MAYLEKCYGNGDNIPKIDERNRMLPPVGTLKINENMEVASGVYIGQCVGAGENAVRQRKINFPTNPICSEFMNVEDDVRTVFAVVSGPSTHFRMRNLLTDMLENYVGSIVAEAESNTVLNRRRFDANRPTLHFSRNECSMGGKNPNKFQPHVDRSEEVANKERINDARNNVEDPSSKNQP